MLEVLQKSINGQDNGKEDFGGGFYSDSGEDQCDFNQHHPLVLSDLVADDDDDITHEPQAGSENGDGSDIEAETAKPMPTASTAPPPFVMRGERSRAMGGGGVGGGGGNG